MAWRPGGSIRDPSELDFAIRALSLMMDTCGIPPARVAFSSAHVLLTTIDVLSPLPCGGELLTHVCLGLHA